MTLYRHFLVWVNFCCQLSVQKKEIYDENWKKRQVTNPTPKMDSDGVVVNFSDRQILPKESTLVEEGKKFALTPNFIKIEDSSTKVKFTIQLLNVEMKMT